MNNQPHINHKIYDEISLYANFYKNLSDSVFGWIKTGTTVAFNFDSYSFISIEETLYSIINTLQHSRVNDCYALIRKHYDLILVDTYVNLYLQENFSAEQLIVENINDWIKGRKVLPRIKTITTYIDKSNILKTINNALQSDDRYQKIRTRCNDYLHFNSLKHLIHNNNKLYDNIQNIQNTYDCISCDLRDLFILHFAYISIINSNYLMSSDYIDSLEMGIPADEKYLTTVAPYISDIFSNTISHYRPDIAEIIKLSSGMEL